MCICFYTCIIYIGALIVSIGFWGPIIVSLIVRIGFWGPIIVSL